MNVPMRSVAPGQREGFASHKTAHTATGSWVRCAFDVGDIMFHFMYSAPFSFDFHSNWLAFAVCPKTDSTCRGFTAYKLYWNTHSYIAKREYYYNIHTLKKCYGKICITGVMGTSHKPEIDIKVMPLSYDDLADVVVCNLSKL